MARNISIIKPIIKHLVIAINAGRSLIELWPRAIVVKEKRKEKREKEITTFRI